MATPYRVREGMEEDLNELHRLMQVRRKQFYESWLERYDMSRINTSFYNVYGENGIKLSVNVALENITCERKQGRNNIEML